MSNFGSVAIGYNNKIDADEAHRILGCGYSTVIKLIKEKKLRAQQIQGKWYLDSEEVYKAKQNGLVRTRNRSLRTTPVAPTFSPPAKEDNETTVVLKLEVDREKFDLIKLAFQGKDKTLVSFLNEKIEGLYEQIKDQLSKVEI